MVTHHHIQKSPVAILMIISGATMLSLMVFTLPLTTLAATVLALHANAGAQAWILSAMPLGAAAGLLSAGALGDNQGRSRVFQGGLMLLVLSSVVGALASHVVVLIFARIFQGLSCAALMACGLGLIGQVYPVGRARSNAAGVWAAGLGAGVALGPIVAAILLKIGGWQASYWASAILAGLFAVAGFFLLPKDPDTTKHEKQKVDYAGSLVLIVGMVAFLAALIEARLGFHPIVFWLLISGLVLFGIFVRIEMRSSNPILHLSLFRRMDFVGATVGAFASGAGVLSIMTLLPTVLERGLGAQPLVAAVVLTAWSAVTAMTALAARSLPKGWSSHGLLVASLIGCGIGQLLLLLVGACNGVWMSIPGLFLAGIANGVLNAALGHQALETVPHHRTAMGSAANNTARYLGSSIGITIAAVIIAQASELKGLSGLFEGWHVAVLVSVVFTIFGILAVVFTGGQQSKQVCI